MPEESVENMSKEELLRMTAEVVSAYVGNNVVPSQQIPEVIKSIYDTLAGIEAPATATEVATPPQKPAVLVKNSITPDFLICLEDGKKLKMLKRHLRTAYSMTPDEYRAKWGLDADYPMVAPNYTKQRSAFAKKIGLGRKPRTRGKK